MSTPTDYTHTNNPRSLHLAQLSLPFPEWVKNTPVPVAQEFVKMASTAFADPSGRRLPILTKEATFFSAVDYFANADKYPDGTFEILKSASEWFGISEEVAPYANVFADEFEKKASEESPADPVVGKFAIETQLNGKDFRLLPLDDHYSIQKSARDLMTMSGDGRIHYLMFVEAAREIVKAASYADMEEPLPHLIREVGEDRFPDFEKAARLVESRRSVITEFPDAFADYTGAVRAAAAGDITSEECMQKIAATDDALGIRYTFNGRSRVPLPHAIVYGGPLVGGAIKFASVNVMVRNVPVPYSVIESIPKLDREFTLSKQASADLSELLTDSDAASVSVAVGKWNSEDQKSLLRLALANAPA